MDELWLRVVIIAVAAIVAALAGYLLRRSRARRGTRIETGDLSAGVYLFTSSDCADCGPARSKLTSQIGAGFTELAWEENPDPFASLSVDVVPATLIVGTDGTGSLHTGVPPNVSRLSILD